MQRLWKIIDLLNSLKERKNRKVISELLSIELGIEAPIIEEAINKFSDIGAFKLFNKLQ